MNVLVADQRTLEEMITFKRAPFHEETIQTMLNKVVSSSTALKTIRK